VTPAAEEGQDATIASDGQGRFIVAWKFDDLGIGADDEIRVLRIEVDGTAICTTGPQNVADATGASGTGHNRPSIAMNAAGDVILAWQGNIAGPGSNDRLMRSDFHFDDDPSTWPVPLLPLTNTRLDIEASVAVSEAGGVKPFGWSYRDLGPGKPPSGIVYGFDPDAPVLPPIRDCEPTAPGNPGDICFTSIWQPTVAAQDDGSFVVCWAEAEEPGSPISVFNIKLQMFDDVGNPIGTEVVANSPLDEVDPSFQESPSIAFHNNRLLVVWTGPALDGCPAVRHVFARCFTWDGVNAPQPVAAPFIVDDSNYTPFSGADANPTVSITPSGEPGLAGRFAVVWNGRNTEFPGEEQIRARFFDADGRPLGDEFRVNQDPVGATDLHSRRIANSAQHTATYTADGTLIVAWTRTMNLGGGQFDRDVFFTMFDAAFAETLCADTVCLKGDANDDFAVDFADVAPFTDALLFGLPAPVTNLCAAPTPTDVCRFDMNGDCLVNGLDIQCFVDTVLGRACTEPLRIIDCNSNEVEDSEDIALGTSFDVNSNGIPDECEADCNGNDTPDDWDIAQHTSIDCDESGRPDECESDCNGNGVNDACDVNPADPDGNGLVSADCNASGIPDECEFDCNSNGVPDDCDVDPTDPDGDEFVSADCNSNGLPDECDLALPPGFGSLDCNTNGIPDECDIASCESDPACDDCNANGIPDGCDIAAQISEDTNSNGIPDECESQQAQGGGGEGGGEMASMSAPGGESFFDEQAAWAEFWDWSCDITQGSNPSLSSEQKFAAMVAKLQELGLPVMNPVMAVSAP
jgi:hypothetical protein